MRTLKKISVTTCVLGLLITTLTGCGGGAAETSKETQVAKGQEGKPKVAVVLKTVSSQYWKFVEAGAKKAFQDLGVEGTVVGPASESQIMEQVNMMEDVLNQKPDALVVAPTQPATAIPVFDRYKQAGIPVLLVDSDANWTDKTAFIGTDNTTAGKTGGEALAKMLKKGDKVALIAGALGNPATDERIKGAKEALTSAGMVIAAEQPADSDKDKAMSVMENMLQTNPDIKGVFSANDDMAIGALRAVTAKGLDIKVIGTDGTIEAVESILSGKLAGSVAQSPYNMGYKGVENAVKAIKGEAVEKRIDSGVEMITKENAQKKLEFLKSISK
ncbi:sugar ABC transporter substrate-binding protein [Aneurinibacillus migulanus]|uniref:Monosaccharide ABC transporter substrate-binding protein, CUT2 family (TC 3.A.1.2.-) n=1 Tax=Aneurinibacillus migulanus TaxID=47500 RepID=A0A0D1XND8_ANEMI|nr:sugar ABC transporter substrate-binding protein [Aneurinibacillus migulanus]KIV53673.1 sugar ABC transporter substrate-binding protein [Aneurinibacillus migulanus]KON97670.1 sugar ABC transporter substrate-binding protein [Aneurinibacillus migulanus]MED0894426.1 sugar ABC transporter substrate-binding protein [Aneurinibacillus migulanus]MED1617036.1 sugar ABC transporter substrate-binding protein [Aneurinibacillus migulanus]SDJ35637.1 monosaccharide ABC transporter substrate-binding protein